MGADTVLHTLLHDPGRVRSATLADIGMGSDDPAWLASWSTTVARSFLEHGSEWTYDHHLADGPLVAGLRRHREHAVDGLRQLVASQAPHAMAFTLTGILATRPSIYELEDRLTAVRRPCLVIRGEEDTLVEGPSRFLERTLPKCESVVIPNASHVTNIQAPTAFNRALLGFLRAQA
jgi:pimeloyl-ACP methyl ester carboxylesterase